MTGNKTSRLSFAVQDAVGTEAIDDATDVTYFFGGREKGQKWKSPSMSADVEVSGSYDSREPTLTPLDPDYKTWMIPHYPTTPQHLIRMMKQVDEDGISPNVHEIEALDSGLPLPLTIRLDLPGGSVDRLYQTVDSYSIGLYWRAMKDDIYYCEEEFAFGRLEDRRGQWKLEDTVSAANGGAKTITLTNTTLTLNQAAGWLCYTNSGTGEDEENVIVSNTAHATTPVLTLTDTPTTVATDTVILFDKLRPILTTAPVMPGYTAPNAYRGTPQVHWDVGDQNVALTECWKVECNHNQIYKTMLDADSKYQTVHLFKMEPLMLTFEAVLERHKILYDYIDRKANQVNVKVYKPDASVYINHKLYNCYIIDAFETGAAAMGKYNCKFIVKAESFIGEFTLESETNWSTHYKEV